METEVRTYGHTYGQTQPLLELTPQGGQLKSMKSGNEMKKLYLQACGLSKGEKALKKDAEGL